MLLFRGVESVRKSTKALPSSLDNDITHKTAGYRGTNSHTLAPSHPNASNISNSSIGALTCSDDSRMASHRRQSSFDSLRPRLPLGNRTGAFRPTFDSTNRGRHRLKVTQALGRGSSERLQGEIQRKRRLGGVLHQSRIAVWFHVNNAIY